MSLFSGRYIRAYIELVRPFTAFPPFFAVVLGAIGGALYTNSHIYIITLLYAGLAMVFAQVFGQITNQLADPIELDKINNKERALVRGDIPRDSVRLIAVAFLIAAIGFSLQVSILYTSLVLITVLSGVIYNYEPFRLKRRFILNNLILAFSRGYIPFVAAWCVFSPIETITHLYAIGLFIWVLGWQTTKDIPDVKGDALYGIRTFPVVWGIHNTVKYMLVMTFIFVMYHVAIGMFDIALGYTALVAISRKDITAKSFTENNKGWVVFYGGIVLYYVIVIIHQVLGSLLAS